jgi:hypothetical protein
MLSVPSMSGVQFSGELASDLRTFAYQGDCAVVAAVELGESTNLALDLRQ